MSRQVTKAELDKVQAENAKLTAEAKTLSRQLEQAELDKVKAEHAKLTAETKLLGRQHRTDWARFMIGTVTAVGAVVGVLLTFLAQTRQLELASQARQDNAFSTLVQQFGGETAKARLAAATGLDTYLGSAQYERYQSQVASLFIANSSVEQVLAVQRITRDVLAGNPTTLVIEALVAHNRRIQSDLADVAGYTSTERLRHHDLAGIRATEDSTRFLELTRELSWNIDALMGALNRKRQVTDLNLSEVMLSLVVVEGPTASPEIDRRFVPRPAEGLEFTRVNLSGASLSWLDFVACKFIDSNLDGVKLTSTLFDDCSFTGTTSLDGFHSTITRFGQPRLVVPTRWVGGTLEVEAFSPQTPPLPGPRENRMYFEFSKVSWRIQAPSEKFLTCVDMPDRENDKDFSGMQRPDAVCRL